jgi:microcystin-dependent protein
MPDLDLLFSPSRPDTPPAFSGSQASEARVSRVNARGVFVVIPAFDRTLEWGPCLPAGATANVGDQVTVVMTNRGRPWLLGAGGGGGDGGHGPSVDVGDVKLTARETAPAGWLLCRGQEIDRQEYAALFEAIGTAYGTGDGSATFNVPDLRDRVAVGAWSEAIGASGGAATVALSPAEMPHHSHGGATHPMDRNIDHLHSGATNGADRSLVHGHAMFWGQVAAAFDRVWGGGTFAELQTVSGGAGWWGGDGMRTFDEGGIDHLHSFTTGGSDRSLDHLHAITGEGGNGAHNNMQPYQRLNYVIKF